MLQDRVALGPITATTGFTVIGGRYLVTVVATFGGGNVIIQKLAADGSTYVDLQESFDKPDGTGGAIEDLGIAEFLANGSKILDLSPGKYQAAITTATAVYVEVARVPLA